MTSSIINTSVVAERYAALIRGSIEIPTGHLILIPHTEWPAHVSAAAAVPEAPFTEHGRFVPQPELPPLAPSPWSPVAPTHTGTYWHWSGLRGEKPSRQTIFNADGVIRQYMGSVTYAADLGGFWMDIALSPSYPDTGVIESQPAPDRFAETLATGSEKLLQQCRVLRCGRFDETAAVIEGVVETMKAAYAAKGAK